MKGLCLSMLYTAKKSLITYFIVSIVVSLLMAIINPLICCFISMLFLISPISDNLKHEKESKWMYYVSTLPTGRNLYIKSYFLLNCILILIGLVIGTVLLTIINHNLNIIIASALIGIGAAGTYAVAFPLTFKFGPENSNAVLTATVFIVLIFYFIVLFAFVYPGMGGADKFENVLTPFNQVVLIIYALFGIITTIISYILSIKIFNKQDL
ncbi:ABC-2 transporter permease [Staphylococcus pasteuri]|uniref:ABC-2 transporter permease n=1 Tax=Staphylococcus pasteuri TaxID=45972 RepID=UPI000D3A4674|nr:ABC-2 transporter permease [Staphylococcus pasteuri]PTU84576.1 ABC-2 transporter permease [Staphylococcus pasteuri]